MKTTLNKIRKFKPCASGWEALLAYIGKTKADDEPLSIMTILESNGIQDALWTLRAVEGHDKELRQYAIWCASQVQHLMKDSRSIDAINTANRVVNGTADKEELAAAAAAAKTAAEAAAETAARAAAASSAAEAAAEDAAWHVAWAAWAAAEAAAGAAAEDAAWHVAWAAEAAAGAAAKTAEDSAEWAAVRAAWDAALQGQERKLIEMCGGMK